MGRFSIIMKLTCHRAMIQMHSFLRLSRRVPCYQWRTMCSNKWSCSSSAIQIKYSLETVSYLAVSTGEAVVHSSSAHSVAGVSIVGNAKLLVGAASRNEEDHKISYEELGRYGIDGSDYADSMTSPQRPQISDGHQTSSLNAVSKSKAENSFPLERKAPYEVVDKTKDDPEETEDIEVTESNDDAEVEENDWCTYLILSNDKGKTYLGVTKNLTRRLRQHNGELAGGAKSARGGRPWSLVCTVRGFGTRSEACQFEWRLKKSSKGYLKVPETLSEEIPTNYQDSHVILRRWAAFKKVHETTDDWKHLQVEWH